MNSLKPDNNSFLAKGGGGLATAVAQRRHRAATGVAALGSAFQAGRRGRRPHFVPPWQGGLQGVWYNPTKTPCRKRRGVPLKGENETPAQRQMPPRRPGLSCTLGKASPQHIDLRRRRYLSWPGSPRQPRAVGADPFSKGDICNPHPSSSRGRLPRSADALR
jgi:hypothetical protein